MAHETVASHGLRSSTDRRVGIFTAETFLDKRIEYSIVDGEAMFEGDIILGSEKEMQDAYARYLLRELGELPLATLDSVPLWIKQRAGELKGAFEAVAIVGFRWKNGEIPYLIQPALPAPQRVEEAIAHWEEHTPIRFRQKTGNDANWVEFRPGMGCSSAVGCRGGRQFVTLGTECSRGNVIHEIGHTVGLWHEQSREDRDDFIELDRTNIRQDMWHNFLQRIADGDDIGGYDFGSIMHYPPGAFAIDPAKPTIKPKQPLSPGVQMGQREGLSAGDIAAVKAMYA